MIQRGTLYVVATPIGNLEDMTYRAVRVLQGVDRIACEDTRVTRVLCDHYGIDAPLLRHDAHNEVPSTDGILQLLKSGESVALVTDAGTPGISDPGQRLVSAAVAGGYRVVPIPGASAVITALSASGLPSSHFTFYGFLSKKSAARRTLFATLPVGTHAFYCPARDLGDVLEDLAETVPEARAVIGRELTKVHESWYRGVVRELIDRVGEDATDASRGEAVLLLHRDEEQGEVTDHVLVQALTPLIAGGVRTKDAASEVSQKYGVPKRRVYQLAIKVEV